MSYLEIRGLQRLFAGVSGVRDFDFATERGAFVSLLGPSGCGKTTVLRTVAGFERPDRGTISLDGREIGRLPVNARRIGMVFQNYALFPNMSVADNVGFGLKVAKRPAAAARARVAEMLDLVQLGPLAERYPYQLSGGQQQRVALARALAVEPKLLLLDEPLSALDAKIRVAVREEIRAVQRRLGITTLFVTHDQGEALAVSDTIVVMNEGRIEQVGTPSAIYNAPTSRFVASFVGTLNLIEARMLDPVAGTLSVDGQTVRSSRMPPDGIAAGSAVTLALRPEAIVLGPAAPGRNALAGEVEHVEFGGAFVRLRIRVGGQRVSIDAFNDPGRPLPEPGQPVEAAFSPSELQFLVR